MSTPYVWRWGLTFLQTGVLLLLHNWFWWFMSLSLPQWLLFHISQILDNNFLYVLMFLSIGFIVSSLRNGTWILTTPFVCLSIGSRNLGIILNFKFCGHLAWRFYCFYCLETNFRSSMTCAWNVLKNNIGDDTAWIPENIQDVLPSPLWISHILDQCCIILFLWW